MANRWFGQREYFAVTVGDPLGQIVVIDIPLDASDIHSGSTIVRTLFGWDVSTDLVDNSSGLQRGVWPANVKLAFTPDPDSDPSGIDPRDAGGDCLWREPVKWEPQTWTDGTLFATKWTGQSGGMRSGQGQRIIHNKFTALLQMAFGFDSGQPGFTNDTDWIPVTATGYLWCDFLVSRAD